MSIEWTDALIHARGAELVAGVAKRTVKTADGCVVLKGGSGTVDPYPRINMPGSGRVKKNAARVLYVARHGPIPEDMVVMHTCGNSQCLNTDHMRIGTRKDVAESRETRGSGEHDKRRGELNGRTKLTEDDVEAILRSNDGNSSLAARYGVDRRAIYSIKNGKTWRHVKKRVDMKGDSDGN